MCIRDSLGTVADQRIRLIEEPSTEVGQAVLDAADCMVSLHRAAGSEHAAVALARYAMRGVPVLASGHGAVAEMFDASSALLVPCHAAGTEPDVQAAALLMRGVADDLGGADEVGLAGRQHLLDTRAVSRVGAALRERVEQVYRGWRARRAVSRPDQVPDPLHAMHAARHALLRRPDVGVASRTPMAPALRKAVLRVLSHYDNHMRDVLTTLVDSVERTAEELLRRQDDVRVGVGIGELDQLRAQLEQLVERQNQLDDQLVGIDDGVIRVRADLAGQGRRMREVEDAVVGEAAKRAKQVDTLAERIDRLTTALDRTLDRIDGLESQLVDVLRERDTRLDGGVRAATQALQTADALRRVVVREHERHSPPVEGVRSSLVLSDAGLLRLPAEDSVMLPLLSSHGVWEPELSELIDALVEPDGIFLDVGAYVGYHTIRVLSRLGTSGAVVAVEPSAPAALLLHHNVEVNVSAAIARRLVVLRAAAWDSPGRLLVEPALTGGVAVRPGQGSGGPSDPGDLGDLGDPGDPSAPPADPAPNATPEAPEVFEVSEARETPAHIEASEPVHAEPGTPPPAGAAGTEVVAIRLDRELENLASTRDLRLSVVRIDVPGRGHRALAGLVRLLRRDRPHVLLEFAAAATESFGDDPITVLREFRTWGYDLVPLGARQPATPEQVMELVGPTRSTTLWLRPRTRPTQPQSGQSPSAQPGPAPSSDLAQAADQVI